MHELVLMIGERDILGSSYPKVIWINLFLVPMIRYWYRGWWVVRDDRWSCSLAFYCYMIWLLESGYRQDLPSHDISLCSLLSAQFISTCIYCDCDWFVVWFSIFSKVWEPYSPPWYLSSLATSILTKWCDTCG